MPEQRTLIAVYAHPDDECIGTGGILARYGAEGVRTVLTLMGPAVIAASAVQVNVLINSGFAASLGNGPVSWLNIAFRLMQLPLGIFGVAIGTVTLPLVSKSAALGNTAEFRATLDSVRPETVPVG